MEPSRIERLRSAATAAAPEDPLAVLMHDPILNTEQAARIVGRPPATLRWWRNQKRGPKCFVVGQRSVAYRLSDVTRWLEQQYADQVVTDPEDAEVAQ